MATITWTGAAGDGLWRNSANWNTGTVPTTGDIAIVNVNANIITDVDITVDQLLLQAGTLTGTGAISWTSDVVVAAGATVQLNGGVQTFAADARFTGEGLVALLASTTLNIVAPVDGDAGGGDDDDGGDDDGGDDDDDGGDDDADADADAITIATEFENAGTVVVQQGILLLEGTGAVAGSFNVAADATVRLRGETHTLTSTTSFVGLGTIEVAVDSTLIVDRTFTIDLDFENRGRVLVTVGVLTLTGEVTGDCDRFDVEAGARLVLGSETHRFINGTRFAGAGTVQLLAGGTIIVNDATAGDDDDDDDDGGAGGADTDTIIIETAFANSGTIVVDSGVLVLAGAVSGDCDVFDIAASAIVQLSGQTQSFTNGTRFTGAGSLQLLSGTFSVNETVTIETTFENRSTVVVETGTLILAGNTVSTGAFNVSAGATVEFSEGTHVLNTGTTFTGAGSIRLTGGTLTLNETVVVDQFELRGGTLVGEANLIANTFIETMGLSFREGESQLITGNLLRVTDGNTAPGQIIYTVTDLPDGGTLLLNGVVLSVNATFTQADINNNLLTYVDGTGSTFSDSFGFSVSNGVEVITTSTFDFSFRSVAQFRSTATAGVFGFVETGALAPVRFTVTGGSASFTNEIGVFVVDDDLGTIRGTAPGEAGYLEAALSRAQIICSVLSNSPNGFEPLARVLEFSTEARLGFYLVADGSTDTALTQLAAGQTPGNVIFSTSSNLRVSDLTAGSFTLNWEDQQGTGDADFNDLTLNAQPTDEMGKEGSGLQASTQQELIDLRSFAGQVPTTFMVNREAAFNNVVGLYVVENEQGAVRDLITGQLITPEQDGYAKAAIEQRVDLELRVENQGSTEIQGQLEAGTILAPYILANTTAADFLASNPENQANQPSQAYFPFLGANPDGVDHLRLLGDNTFGFEDQFGGGDMDFNDLVFTICVFPA